MDIGRHLHHRPRVGGVVEHPRCAVRRGESAEAAARTRPVRRAGSGRRATQRQAEADARGRLGLRRVNQHSRRFHVGQ